MRGQQRPQITRELFLLCGEQREIRSKQPGADIVESIAGKSAKAQAVSALDRKRQQELQMPIPVTGEEKRFLILGSVPA